MPSSPKKATPDAANPNVSVDQFQEELNNVVKRMDQVEQRLLRNEKQLEGPVKNATSNSSTLHEYQKNLLIQLRQLRDTMNQEGSSLEKIRQEKDQAVQERDELKKQVAKLEYRILHLKQHVTLA